MKKLVLILTLVAGLSSATFAYANAKSPQERAAHATKLLRKKLNLSADQTAQVNSIMLVQANRMDTLKSLSLTSRKLNKLSKATIMLNTDEDLSFVLNPGQLKLYESWKAIKKQSRLAKTNAENMSANVHIKNEF